MSQEFVKSGMINDFKLKIWMIDVETWSTIVNKHLQKINIYCL